MIAKEMEPPRVEGAESNRCRVSVWDDEKVLVRDSGNGYTTVGLYLMPLIWYTQRWLNW